jgi:imidazolonepropionase-like amidohydrolase
MRERLRAWASAIALCLMGGQLAGAQTAEPDTFALRDVSVVDLRAGTTRAGQTVVWERSRIVTVAPAASVRLPPNARVVAGEGRFLLPGLWDMHVHLLLDAKLQSFTEASVLPAYIAHGVTAVRDMADLDIEHPRESAAPLKKRWDAEARAGLRIGPRIVATGSFIVDGPREPGTFPRRPAFFDAATPADARKLVHFLADEGAVDFIKVYSRLPRDSYFALLEEARRAGVIVAGHKPLAVSYVEAADAGQKSMEHAREMLLDSFPGATDLQRLPAERNLPPVRLKQILDTHEPRMLRDIFDAMLRNGAYYVPTHLTRLFDWKAAAGDAAYLNDARLRTVPEPTRTEMRKDVERTQARAAAPGDADVYRAFFEKGLEVTRLAHQAGVKLMVGTDSGDSYCFHGSGLHDEMAWMVRSGLSPLDVLRAATQVPAEYMNRSQDFGAVEAGKMADLVLLDRNPLVDIAHVRAIRAVVFNGRLFDRPALDAMAKGAH